MPVVSRFPLVAMFVALTAFTAFGATIVGAPEVQGRWRMTSDDLNFASSFTKPGERAAFLAALSGLIGPFKRLPVLSSPRGFDARWSRGIRGSIYAQGRWAIPGYVSLRFFEYLRLCPTCPAKPSVVSDVGFEMWVNSIDSLYGEIFGDRYKSLASDEAGGIFYEPVLMGEVQGFRRYERGIVISSRPVPLFVPVTRARFLRSKIAESTAEVQRWAREKGKDAEHIMRERQARETLQAFERELASLPPAARQSQAWCCDYSQMDVKPSLLAEAGAKDARPLVSTNWSYFDRTKPRSALQLIILQDNRPNRATHMVRVYETAWQTLDWKALAALLTR